MRTEHWLWTAAWVVSACSSTHMPAEGGGNQPSTENAGAMADDEAEPAPSDEPEARQGEAPEANVDEAPGEPGDVMVVAGPSSESGTEGPCPPDFYSETDPIIPEPLALPAATDLPPECDEEAAIALAIEACGPVQRIDVQGSLADALAQCASDRFCHVVVPAGEHAYQLEEPEDGTPSLRCMMIEGAGAQATRIQTSGIRTAEHVVLARLHARGSYGSVSAENGPLLINEADLVGGYEGVGVSWGAAGVAVCRSSVRGGYSGVDLSWESTDLVVAGSAIAACYEGVGLSWMSHHALLVDNSIFGAYAAVSTSWSSHDLSVLSNQLASSGGADWPGAAVDLHMAFAVEIRDNVVLSGMLPSSDPGRDIIVEGNETP